MATTTFTIGGAAVDLTKYTLGTLVAFVKDGVPSLTFYRRGGALAGLPDPWLGKAAVLTINGTTYFQGDVVSANPVYEDHLGWVTAYQCLGLRYRGNLIPFTDDNTGLDTAPFNLQPEDPSYIASRAGRTVGQILTAVLTMQTNSANLANFGLGNYSSLGPPAVLPTATVNDLAAMSVIPPAPVYVAGEKLIDALDGLLAQWAPNYTLWIDPATGNLRFLDMRQFTAHTFTLGTDPILPTPLSRDLTDCFQRVEIRGQPWVEPMMLTWKLSLGHDGTQTGGLEENFQNGSYPTNAAAIAAWNPAVYAQPGAASDTGTCSCPSTTTVTVTSSSSTATWGANFWDQTSTGAHGTISLSSSSLTTLVTQFVTRRIVANTALSAGGTSTLTLDLPIPVTSYDSYTIYGLQQGESVVWRRYKAVNSAVGAALQNSFPYPVPYIGASGNSVTLTSAPAGSVLWSTSGNPPYNEFPLPFTQDPSSGTFTFVSPTWSMANRASPAMVRILAAVATGANQVFSPQNSGASAPGTPPTATGYTAGTPAFAGTSHTVDGLSRTLVVTVPGWRDPGNYAGMQAYADDMLDSVKDAIVEGEITYLDLYEPALTMGMAANVAGNGYTTGWESLTSFPGYPGLPVTMVELEWSLTGPVQHITRLKCSNRRVHYTAGTFLKPPRAGLTWTQPEWTAPSLPSPEPETRGAE